MAGFSLYETLRIFLPGLFAVSLFNLAVRLATAPAGVAPPDQTAGWLRDGLVSPVAGVAAVVIVGLVLYMLNVPDRLRVYYPGDPNGKKAAPSRTLADWVRNTDHNSLSIFFILQDEAMAEKLVERIYFFGSIFKVVVWLRVLLVATVTFGCLASLLLGVNTTSAPLRADWLAVTVIILAAGGMWLQGWSARRNGEARAARWGPQNAQSQSRLRSRKRVWAKLHPRRSRGENLPVTEASDSPLGALPAWMASGLAVSALLVVISRPWPTALLCTSVLAVVAFTLGGVIWLALELGPPAASLTGQMAGREDSEPNPNTLSLREHLLNRLGVDPSVSPRFDAPWRTLIDATLLIPALIAGSVGAASLGGHASSVLPWAALAMASSSLGASPKHEDRLLNVYGDQTAWLNLHRKAIMAFIGGEISARDVSTYRDES